MKVLHLPIGDHIADSYFHLFVSLIEQFTRKKGGSQRRVDKTYKLKENAVAALKKNRQHGRFGSAYYSGYTGMPFRINNFTLSETQIGDRACRKKARVCPAPRKDIPSFKGFRFLDAAPFAPKGST